MNKSSFPFYLNQTNGIPCEFHALLILYQIYVDPFGGSLGGVCLP